MSDDTREWQLVPRRSGGVEARGPHPIGPDENPTVVPKHRLVAAEKELEARRYERESWRYERDLAHRNTAKAEDALSAAEAERDEAIKDRDEWKQDAEDFSAIDEIKMLRARVESLTEALKDLAPFWEKPIPVELGLALKASYGEETVAQIVHALDVARRVLASKEEQG